MATNVRKKISELTALESASLDTVIVGVDNGTTYKIELDVLADAVTSRVNILDRSRLSSLESVTSSFETKGANIISASAQISALGFTTSSSDLTSLNSFTSSQSTLNSAFTSGINARLQTSSFNEFSASVHSEIVAATNEQDLSHLATTGSNVFKGDTTLSGSLILANNKDIILRGPGDDGYSGSGDIVWQDAGGNEMARLWKSADNHRLTVAFTGSQNSYVFGTIIHSLNLKEFGDDHFTTTSSFNQYTASISTASLVDRLNDLENNTGSYLTSLDGAISSSSQLTASYDERYVLSGSITQTTWDNISGKPSGLVSQSTDLTSLNNFTASISTASLVNRLNSIESVSGSWITESETGSFLTSLNGAISASSQITAFGFVSGSYETTGRGIISSSANLVTITAFNDYTASISTASLVTSINNLNTYTASQSTASLVTSITNLNNATSSYETIGRGIVSGSSQLTSSYDSRYTLSGSVSAVPSGTISGSAQITAFGFVSASSAVPAGTISGSAQITAFGFVSGSYTTTSSFNSFTASAQTVTTGSNSFNGTQIITGSLIVTTGSFVGSQILANTSSLYLTSGSNMYVQNNGVVEITGSLVVSGSTSMNLIVPSVMIGTGSGNEGGEINLAYAATNNTLTGSSLTLDVYQSKLRIFEGGGDSRGVSIDISKAPTGVSGELIWKTAGFVNAGTFVQLDNLKCTVTTSGNRGLSIGAVSTTFVANIDSRYSVVGGAGGGQANNITYTTTASTSAFAYQFPSEGDTSVYNILDKTNSRFYRVTLMIGSGYNNNFISIERLY